jgi:hypothetical protein
MYRLVKFGTQMLEYYNQVDDIGSGVTPSGYIPLPEGGALDIYGSARKYAGAVERSKSVRLAAATETALSSLYFALLKLVGTRNKLYRRVYDGSLHWQWARLVEMSAARDYEKTRYKLFQDVALRFVAQEATWRGKYEVAWVLDGGIYLDDGYYLDAPDWTFSLTAGVNNFTITVGAETDAGRAPVRAMQIRLTADGGSAIDGMTLARYIAEPEVELESMLFDAAIPSGETLLIDTGSMQVTLDGADAYADFAQDGINGGGAWFILTPGINNIACVLGGTGGASIQFTFYEAWY